MESRKLIESLDRNRVGLKPYVVTSLIGGERHDKGHTTRAEAIEYAKEQYSKPEVTEVLIERCGMKIARIAKPDDTIACLEGKRITGKGPVTEAKPVSLGDISWALKTSGREYQELSALGLPGEVIHSILGLPSQGFGIDAKGLRKAVRDILSQAKIPFKESVETAHLEKLDEKSAVAPKHVKGFDKLSDWGKHLLEWLVSAPTLPLQSVLERGPFNRLINEKVIHELTAKGILAISKGKIVAVKSGALKSPAAYSAYRASIGEVVKKGGRPPMENTVVERLDSLRVRRREEDAQ